MQVLTTRAALVAHLQARRDGSPSLGLVPTMGALHAGHRALIERAAAHNDTVAVSIFVNPTQFGQGEDYAHYPRDLERDLEIAASAGASACFVPAVGEMYPAGSFAVAVDPGPLGLLLEGASRPGHFRGVATVVTKLLALCCPDRAYFGEKDYQQLLIIKRLVDELGFRTEVVAVPTVREPDGLAVSSRNVRLSPSEREAARALSAALFSGEQLARKGGAPQVVEAHMAEILAAAPGVQADYACCVDADNLEPASASTRALRLLVAARVGSVRLIDNLGVER